MIWISTLCLLAVAVWLFFNALNERRWVESHSHDETVASDEGLLPNFTALTRTAMPKGSNKLSMDQVNSGISQAAAKVKQTTASYTEKLADSRAAAAARKNETSASGGTPTAQSSMMSRIVEKVGATADTLDQRLEARVRSATSETAPATTGNQKPVDVIRNTTKKVALKSEEIAQRVAHKTKIAADNYSSGAGMRSEDGLIGKVTSSVSGGIGSVEKMVKSRLSSNQTGGANKSDDLIARVSAKVSARTGTNPTVKSTETTTERQTDNVS